MFHQMGNEKIKKYPNSRKKEAQLWKKLTIAEAVMTHLGLDMLGNVSIDSYLMMDCVLK